MEVKGICHICGKPGRMNTCRLCGSLICIECIDHSSGLCKSCSQGTRYK